jgi:hypothetical protein
VTRAAQPVVGDAPDPIGRIAAGVVAEKVMGEKQVATAGQDRHLIPKSRWRVEHRRVAAHGQESAGAALLEEPLVVQVRARPDPKVAGLGLLLVDEVYGGQHRERVGPPLVRSVAIHMRPAGPVVAGRVVEGDLDVIEGEVERARRDQLHRDIQSPRVPERSVGSGKLSRRQEPEVLANCAGRWRIGPCQSINLLVNRGQQALGDDARDDQVAVLPKPPQLITGQPTGPYPRSLRHAISVRSSEC